MPSSKYMLCDGSQLLISDYQDLYNVIGTTFNQLKIDNTKYFNLPDFRGMFLRGADNSGRKLGSTQDWSTGIPKIPFTTGSAGGHNHSVSGDNSTDNNDHTWTGAFAGSDTQTIRFNLNTSSAGNHTHPVLGGDSETRPINVSINFIIKVLN